MQVEVTIEEAYAEACRVIGEQSMTLRLMAREKQQVAPSVVLDRDGVKVYGPHPDASYTASWGGQWLSGSWPDPESAYSGALEQITGPSEEKR